MASLVQPAGIASSGASAATRNPLMCEKFEDLEIDAAADRVFKAWMDITGICAKLMTDTVTHARCISSDADHHSVGGIVELLYPPGKAAFTGKCTCARDVYRHTHVDYDKRFHTYQFLEGQVMEVCKFYNGTVEVVPTDSGKCVVKHRVEFELIDVNVPHSSAMQEQVGYVLFKRIEQYLKENETAYV